uniref:Uncharacterized protein n=1 Tax=Oryza brachyantha TaxID=4533 RepID=J3MKQ4_ORYBR
MADALLDTKSRPLTYASQIHTNSRARDNGLATRMRTRSSRCSRNPHPIGALNNQSTKWD